MGLCCFRLSSQSRVFCLRPSPATGIETWGRDGRCCDPGRATRFKQRETSGAVGGGDVTGRRDGHFPGDARGDTWRLSSGQSRRGVGGTCVRGGISIRLADRTGAPGDTAAGTCGAFGSPGDAVAPVDELCAWCGCDVARMRDFWGLRDGWPAVVAHARLCAACYGDAADKIGAPPVEQRNAA